MSAESVYNYGVETTQFRDEYDVAMSEFDALSRSPLHDPRENETVVNAAEVTRRMTFRRSLWRKLYDWSRSDFRCPPDVQAAFEDAEQVGCCDTRMTLNEVAIDWIRSHEQDLRRSTGPTLQSWIDKLVRPLS